MQYYAEVILPLALPQFFTYRIPADLAQQAQPGVRVIVQFGKRKLYTAIVHHCHTHAPEDFRPKDLLEVEDEQAIVTSAQLELWEWMAEYYCCTIGEVMQAALPSGLKLESEMVILRNQLITPDDDDLEDTEFLVLEALDAQERLTINEVSQISGLQNPMRLIKDLLGKRFILLEEELKMGYKPVKKRMVRLHSALSEDDIPQLLEELEKAPKQRELLLHFFQLRRGQKGTVAASVLLKRSRASDGSLKSLASKNILELYYESSGQISLSSTTGQSPYTLSAAQQEALEQVNSATARGKTALLHGVTSSGKTELYVHLIHSHLASGRQVLYLVPEIALTTQLIERLRKFFGDAVVVYHSRFSDRERVESWLRLLKGDGSQGQLIVGARSSVFLPLDRLGLVIVDEEHESSYKQYDPAPRYHARDTAQMIAHRCQAAVLLGSATPSLESYHHAVQGKYVLVNLKQRHGNIPLPEITCVDLKEARRQRKMRGALSEDLQLSLEETLKKGKQAILFQNRRGFSTFIQCQTCGEVVQCRNCDISMTYHRMSDLLRCHYCGYTRQIPQSCPACGSHEVRSLGTGTEKLEDDLRLSFPEAQVQRMDLDTTRKKNAFEGIISSFEEGATDILVGTQMVTKGLDFGNVALVGIINADMALNFPDFRSHERAFQLLAQVAGRAGRRGERGQVMIQTAEPYHHVIRKVMENRYEDFYQEEMIERRRFRYPPEVKLIRIRTKHRNRDHLLERTRELGRRLRQGFGDRLLGPEFPLTARLRNYYHMQMLLKLEPTVSLKKAKSRLLNITADYEQAYPSKRIFISFDVDPY